tara:strand:- start:55 stop:1419 length:1365 start_codon:yes stop_codon:yes gene_type:complete
MALEPSEIFTASAMCFTEERLNKVIDRGVLGVVHFFEYAKEKAEQDVEIPEMRSQWLDFFNNPDSDKNTAMLVDMVRGISAAKAVKEWMKAHHGISNPVAEKVFMTGNVWPKEVQPLEVKAHGFGAYNSSDIIVRPFGHPHAYFGVSLKKKPKEEDPDPTLINKAFDTVLNGKEFDKIKTEIEKLRESYFAGLVKEAVKEGLIDLDLRGKNDKVLYRPSKSVREKEGFKRAYIDTKGSLKMPEIGSDPLNPKTKGWEQYGDSQLGRSQLRSRKDTMRNWVNTQLGKKNKLYDGFLKVMNDNVDVFAETLVNVTLKTDLPNLMKADDGKGMGFGDMKFGFALVTGIGTKQKRLFESGGKVVLSKGKAYDIDCVLKGIAHLEENPTKYNFEVTNRKDTSDDNMDEGGAAKIYFDLKKGNIVIMNMELRYKGGFTSQPQFFGTMSKEFKKILEGKCI